MIDLGARILAGGVYVLGVDLMKPVDGALSGSIDTDICPERPVVVVIPFFSS